VTPEQMIADAWRAGRRALDEPSGKRVLASFGIPVPRFAFAASADDAASAAHALSPPLAVKVVSEGILHKSDVGGVRLGLHDGEETARAIAAMAASPALAGMRIEGWLIEEMAPVGQELVIGGFHDPQFGPMVMVGLGGVFVEIVKDVAFRICPIEPADAHAMLDELKGAALLDGARGRKPLARRAVVDALMKVAGRDGLLMRLADCVAELDINPIIVNENGLMAVDARVILSSPDAASNAARTAVAKPGDDRPVLERFRPLFEPRTVAIVGASTKGVPMANTFIRRMKDFGFAGELYPIHPQAAEIEGVAAYKSLRETPKPVDYAYVALGAERIPALLAEAEGRVRFAQVISSGFGEIAGGDVLERDLVEKAHKAGVRVIGPNCLGTYSPRGGLTFPDKAPRDTGCIGLISQSGGLTTNMIKRGQSRGLRFSGAVTVGNCADVQVADLVAFYLADPHTRAIGCYVEDVKDGRRLFELMRDRASRKPVVLLRGGRSSQGRIAAQSHTGALAGDNRGWSALTAQTPCVEVDTLDEFVDTLLALQHIELRPQRPTRKVVMFGNGGGSSVLGADFFAGLGLDVSPFAPAVLAQLEAIEVPPGTSVANPIDTPVATLQENGGLIARQILDIVYADGQPDAIALHLNMSSFSGRGGVDPIDNIFGFIEAAMAAHAGAAHVLVAFRTDDDPALEERKRGYRQTAMRLGIPMFNEIPEMAKALAAIAHLERRLAAADAY
jgi:acyl-CoA synthetase (NDP forming)